VVNGAGERVLINGVYRVTHLGHRGSHEATLNEGEVFPACNVCKDKVIFEFVRHVDENQPQPEHIQYDPDFRKA
jgi:hypothetical protein